MTSRLMARHNAGGHEHVLDEHGRVVHEGHSEHWPPYESAAAGAIGAEATQPAHGEHAPGDMKSEHQEADMAHMYDHVVGLEGDGKVGFTA
jgi:hypothetical protein